MALEVIGTGFGRTGTDSMREALNILGFGPCHHMVEVMANGTQKRRWRTLAAGGRADWESLFEGYRSCLDWPSAFYWRELIDAYPRASVILTNRSPESWWESFSKTIVPAIAGTTEPDSLGITLIAGKVFGGKPDDRDHAIAAYKANVDRVVRTVPPERLLVHNLGDGWEPLCRFLGAAVPDVPYPSRNNTEAFNARQ